MCALLFSVHFGCSDNKPVSVSTKSRVKKKAAPAPVIKDVRKRRNIFDNATKFEYSYNPIGKRDPFRINIDFSEEKLPGNSKLLKYSLDQLKVTAIIWGIAKPRALIEAPGGESFIVKKGDLIGRNYGRIDRIEKNDIVVIEEYPGPLGKLIVNEIVLPLEVQQSGEIELY